MIITPKTKYTALIGHPVAHSISPILHNKVYRKIGLDMAYLAHSIEADDLRDGIKGLQALGYIGFNVTIPHKESIIEHLDIIDPTAKAIGAVNTVKNVEGKLIGYNTDGLGFMESLKSSNVECSHSTITILGAGGAARAIAMSLVEKNPEEIHIINRSQERGLKLARDINKFAGYELSRLSETIPVYADIIINTTPLGMWPHSEGNPLAEYSLNSKSVVCDIVYNPIETSMLKQARNSGCVTINGLGMLVGQGMKALEIWTGKTIDSSTIKWITHELINYMKTATP